MPLASVQMSLFKTPTPTLTPFRFSLVLFTVTLTAFFLSIPLVSCQYNRYVQESSVFGGNFQQAPREQQLSFSGDESINQRNQSVKQAQRPPSMKELADLAAGQLASLITNQWHIFDKQHQYLAGHFNYNGQRPEGISFHISPQGTNSSIAAGIGSYKWGEKSGYFIRFDNDGIALEEYEKDSRKANPVIIPASSCPGLYNFYRQGCADKVEFFQQLAESMNAVLRPNVPEEYRPVMQ